MPSANCIGEPAPTRSLPYDKLTRDDKAQLKFSEDQYTSVATTITVDERDERTGRHAGFNTELQSTQPVDRHASETQYLLDKTSEGFPAGVKQHLRTIAARCTFTFLGKATSFVWESGITSIIISSFFASLQLLFIKLLEERLPLSEILMFQSGFGSIFCLLLSKASGVKAPYGQRRWWLVARGLCGASSMLLYSASLTRLDLSEAVTLFFINPVFTTLLAWVALGEAIRPSALLGCCASLAGVVLIAQPPFLFGGAEPWNAYRLGGLLMNLGCSFVAAFTFIIIRHLKKQEPTVVLATYFHHCTFLAAISLLVLEYPQTLLLPMGMEWLLLGGLVTAGFSAQLFLNRAFQLEAAAKICILGYLQVVYSHIWGVLLLGEHETWMSLLGTACIASGVIGSSLSRSDLEVVHNLDATSGGKNGAAAAEVNEACTLLGGRAGCRESDDGFSGLEQPAVCTVEEV